MRDDGRYGRVKAFIRRWEGGYTEADGRATMWGVTLKTFRSFYGWSKTKDDLRAITEEEWDHIFRRGYWQTVQGDKIKSEAVAAAFADWYWMSGRVALKGMQRLLEVDDDCIIGVKTLKAIDSRPPAILFRSVISERLRLMRQLKTWSKFGRGWTSRMSDLVNTFSPYA